MKIKKQLLEPLYNLTKGTGGVLSLSEARKRDVFFQELEKIVARFDEDRQKIYKAFCIKKEDGTPDLKDGDKYQFPVDKVEEMNTELENLYAEEEEIETAQDLKLILEKSEYKPKINESVLIDEVLKLFV